MSDSAGELIVEVSGKDVNLTAFLNRIEQQLTKAEQTGQRAGKSIGEGVGNGAQRAANAALAMQQAVARLEVAQGNAAGAADRLRDALAGQEGTTVQAINAQRQLVQVENQLAQSANGSQQFVNAFKQGLIGFAAPAVLANTALGALKGTVESFKDAFEFKAELDATTTSIKTQLDGVRDTSAVFSQAARYANTYKLTQKETNDAIVASIPVIQKSKASMEEILGVFDRLRIKQPGKTFEDAARALGELQAGQVVSLEHVFNVLPKDANRMKEEIAGGADAVQVLSKYLTNAGIGMDALKAHTQGAMGAMKDLAKAQEDLKLAQGQLAQSAGGILVVQEEGRIFQGLANVLNGQFIPGLKATANELAASQAQQQAYADALQAGKTEAEAAAIGEQAYAVSLQQGAITLGLAKAATDEHARSVDASSKAHTEFAGVLQVVSNAIAAEISKKIESEQESTQLSQAQAQLAADSRLAAQGLLGAGDQALILAQKYGIAAEQAQFLILQQQRLSNAQALSDQRAGERSGGRFNSDIEVQRNADAARAEARNAEALQAARDAQVIATGNHYQKLQTLQKQYNAAVAQYGKDSVQAVAAQTRLMEAQQEKQRRAAGGKTRLTDQQKLQNQLLASQDQYDNKSEDAETSHQQRLLEIQQNFDEKMRDAQRAFQLASLDDRESFYESLAGIEDNGLRQAMSAKYEAAAQKAQQIAQEKGADAGQAYMEAAQQAIQKEGKLQEEIDKASNKKDKEHYDPAKAEYYRGLLAQQQAADAERLKQIEENGSAIANERDKQIADEESKYTAAKDKIQLADDRATDRIITNAERRGAKIDEEQAKLDELASTHERLAGGNSGSPSTSSSSSSSGAPAGDAQTGPINPDAILAKLDELRAAVVAATDKGADKVASAVKTLKSNGGVAG